MDSEESNCNEIKEEKLPNQPVLLGLKEQRSVRFTCEVCPKSYKSFQMLRYHIRREHYNMIEKITGIENRMVNEVWFERVLNSDAVVTITKTGCNKYMMKRARDSNCILIEEYKDILNLSALYPIGYRQSIKVLQCHVCYKNIFITEFKKHMDEIHYDRIL